MQKRTTFTTIFGEKKCYFHYDFACKKVPLSLRYAKKIFFKFRVHFWHLRYVTNDQHPSDIGLENLFRFYYSGYFSRI
jgi:hypothetical protein